MTDVKTSSEILQDGAPKEVVLIGENFIPTARPGEGFRNKLTGDDAGVWFEKEGEKGSYKCRICDPLSVTAIDSDVNEENCGLTAAFKNVFGTLKTVRIGLNELSTAADRLRGMGLIIDEQQGARASKVADYLSAVVKDHERQKIPRVKRVTRGGWLSDRFDAFAFPEGVMTVKGITGNNGYTVEFPVLPLDSKFSGKGPFSVSGTLEQWRGSIGKMSLLSDRLMLSLCIGFAGPLIELLGIPNSPGVHFYGESSKGKSTTVRGASSIFGSGPYTWNTSNNGAEVYTASHNGMVFLLDELGEADVSAMKLLYQIGNGSGKLRMNPNGTAKNVFTWHLTWMSAGELTSNEAKKALTGRSTTAGEEVRLLNIPAEAAGCENGIFDSLPEGKTPKEIADSYSAAASEYRGTAGREFVQKLIEDIAADGVAGVRRRFAEFSSAFGRIAAAGKSFDSQQQRVLGFFAVFAFAGELAVKYGVLPWQENQAQGAALSCFNAWNTRDGNRSDRTQMAIQELAFVDLSEAKVFDVESGSDIPKQEPSPNAMKCAALIRENGVPVLAFYTPERFAAAVKRAESTMPDVVKAFLSIGALWDQDRTKHKARIRNARFGIPYRWFWVIFVEAVANGGHLPESRVKELQEMVSSRGRQKGQP